MTMLEIVLLIGGVLCIIASFFVGGKEEVINEEAGEPKVRELSEQDKELIKKQIEALIEEQISDVSEKTEARLDKISNTKILEMNDYAETIIGEINRNHNEAVFLYDMLNEKAKEVKSAVKDVNAVRREVAATVSNDDLRVDTLSGLGSMGTDNNSVPDVRKDMAKERLVELAKKSAERSREPQQESLAEIGKSTSDKVTQKHQNNQNISGENEKLQKEIAKIKSDKSAGKNDIIIALHKLGLDNKAIAKELNLGVGEVKLIIDLYSRDK